jgi:hypothetical protein
MSINYNATERQPKSGAARAWHVATSVNLLKFSENHLVVLVRNSGPGIGNSEQQSIAVFSCCKANLHGATTVNQGILHEV